MDGKTFKEIEHKVWLTKADTYRDAFGKITEQAADPILNTFGDLSQKKLLDIACGTGELVAAAAERGATPEGLDFAATMVEVANQKYPDIRFTEGDAEHLPYPDASFDAVVCSFGLLHLPNPDQAIAEARRVLRIGGRYTFTVWCGPEQGGDFFKLIMDAIGEYGTFDVPLPPAPPLFRFADDEECRRTLMEAGFVSPTVSIIELELQLRNATDILDFIYKNIVRTSLVLLAQSEDARERIHQEIVQGAESHRMGNEIRFRFPAILATAAAFISSGA